MYKVYLDPGHGGIDSGAVGCGKRESDCALQVAQTVCKLLPSRYFDVRMSRNSQHIPNDSDPNGDLMRRCREANGWGADIYVSIHLNSGGGTGAETYYDTHGGKSLTLAQDIQSAVQSCAGIRAHGVSCKPNILHGERDYLCVIRETAMPAVLHECCFIDSASDMDKFRPYLWARGICDGIMQYFGVSTPLSAPVKPALRLAAANAPFVSDTTTDVTAHNYTVRVRCVSGCPNVSAGTGAVADITRTGISGNDYFFRISAKKQGQTGIFVNGKKIFVFKAV